MMEVLHWCKTLRIVARMSEIQNETKPRTEVSGVLFIFVTFLLVIQIYEIQYSVVFKVRATRGAQQFGQA